MAIRYYDDAIYEKIQKWIKDPNMRVLKPNESTRLFSMKADQNNDQPLKLPFISISRDSTVTLSVTGKRNLTYDGAVLDSRKKDTIHLDAIPIELSYQIDIYTRRYDECDEYIRNFVFNFVNHPKMKVLLPYNGANIEHVCFARLNESITDNSDVPEKLFADEFTRFTLTVDIQDAYLFGIPITENKEVVGAELYIENKDIDHYEKEAIPINSEN